MNRRYLQASDAGIGGTGIGGNRGALDPLSSTVPEDAVIGVATTHGVSLWQGVHLDDLLHVAVKLGASDLHLRSNGAPAVRIQGKLKPLKIEITTEHPHGLISLCTGLKFSVSDEQRVDSKTAHRILDDVLRDDLKVKMDTLRQADFSYALPKSDFRFRVNAYTSNEGRCLVCRTIPNVVPTMEELGLPPVLKKILSYANGLVLVTGPTGSGKSTTLAAVIDEINTTLNRNIISLEEPIEYVHKEKGCIISQREVPLHCPTFAEGIRGALREDPDVILLGEMRDLETAATAITAAETGHLVLATLHTNSAAETIHRLIEQFPEGQQAQIRSQVSQSLKMVVAQSLVPTTDGKRVAVFEVMVVNPAIANQIRMNKSEQMTSTIQTSKNEGMMTKEQQLAALVQAGRVSRDVAFTYSNYPSELEKMLNLPTDSNAPRR
jgi:twitching motility protein PilT